MTITSPGLNFAALDCFECGFFGIENARGAAVQHAFVAGEFYDAAFGSERAVQNREAAIGLERIQQRTNYFLAGSFAGIANFVE